MSGTLPSDEAATPTSRSSPLVTFSRAVRRTGFVDVYSAAILGSVGLLLPIGLANAVGVPDGLVGPPAAILLLIILHPIGLPYWLATALEGGRTGYGPSVDAAWNKVFLTCFTPYVLLLCWLIFRRLWLGRAWQAVRLMLLFGLYEAVCVFLTLAQT